MKTKKALKILFGLSWVLMIILVSNQSFGFDVGSYKVLEPSFIGTTEITSFAQWAQLLLKTALGLIAGLAVIQLAYGGVQYVLSASYGGKNDGKKHIQDAFIGLGIALSAWLILKIINPDLVNFPSFLQ